MLLTLHFSQQKFTEDVLQHVCNTQTFIKILGRSLLISHLMLLIHHILPFLLVGPSGKEWQTPPNTKYSRNMAAFLLCQDGAALSQQWLHFFHFSVSLWSQWSPTWTQVCHCMLSTMWGKSNTLLPCPSRSKSSVSFQKWSCRWGSEDKNLRALRRQKWVWWKQKP